MITILEANKFNMKQIKNISKQFHFSMISILRLSMDFFLQKKRKATKFYLSIPSAICKCLWSIPLHFLWLPLLPPQVGNAFLCCTYLFSLYFALIFEIYVPVELLQKVAIIAQRLLLDKAEHFREAARKGEKVLRKKH